MAELKINLEQGNNLFYAHATEFLGSFAKANTKEEVLDELLKDVKSFSEWILTKELNSECKTKAKEYLSGINKLDIVEEIKDIEKLGEKTGTSALFQSDKETMIAEMFEVYIQIIKILPDELARIIFQLSDEDREKIVIEGKPSINGELTLFCDMELNYITKFGLELEQKFLDAVNKTKEELKSLPILEKLLEVKQGVIALLRAQFSKLNESEFTIEEDGKIIEIWTLKKIIRIIIELDRDHIRTIKFLAESIEKLKENNNSNINNNETK